MVQKHLASAKKKGVAEWGNKSDKITTSHCAESPNSKTLGAGIHKMQGKAAFTTSTHVPTPSHSTRLGLDRHYQRTFSNVISVTLTPVLSTDVFKRYSNSNEGLV